MNKSLIYIILALLLASCGNNTGKAAAETAAEPSLDVVNFDADSCMAYLKAQVDFGPRVPDTDAHRLTADYLANTLRANGADVSVQSTSAQTAQGKKIPVYNILGRFAAERNTRILLLAHWDTRPWADEDPNENNHDKPIDGANDGASGVAVLLEIARLLGSQMPENIGIDILFVDAEDSGASGDDSSWCLGTQLWVKSMPYTAVNTPKYAILLDMVGGRNAKFHREYLSDYYARSVVDRVWSIASSSGYATRFINATGGAITDDHVIINRAGIPAIDIIENKNNETGSFNPTWHTLDDNVRNIDINTLKAVGQVVANCIYNHK